MFKTIFYKELQENIVNRKFYVVLFLIVAIIPLGFYVSYNEYLARLHNYQESLRIYQSDHQKVNDVMFKEGGKAFRPPSPLNFLSRGLELFLPTVAETYGIIFNRSYVELRYNNSQSQDYLYDSLYGPLDLSSIVSIIMAFFALVFTFNAVSGEKEKGTLGLMLANPISRKSILSAKICANVILLFSPILIALLIGILILQSQNLAFFGVWPYILLAMIFSFLLIGVFFNLGVLFSTLTRRAVTAIVALALIWVMLFGILPRLSVILSQALYPVKSHQLIALEKKQLRLNNQRECEAEIDLLISAYGEHIERRLYEGFREEQDAIRARYQARLLEQCDALDEDMESRRQVQSRIASQIALLSPVSCYIGALAEIANTGIMEYGNFQQRVGQYQRTLNEEIFSKNSYYRTGGSVGSSFSGDGNAPAPYFAAHSVDFEKIFNAILTELVALMLYNMLFFSLAFVRFMRYDAR